MGKKDVRKSWDDAEVDKNAKYFLEFPLVHDESYIFATKYSNFLESADFIVNLLFFPVDHSSQVDINRS